MCRRRSPTKKLLVELSNEDVLFNFLEDKTNHDLDYLTRLEKSLGSHVSKEVIAEVLAIEMEHKEDANFSNNNTNPSEQYEMVLMSSKNLDISSTNVNSTLETIIIDNQPS